MKITQDNFENQSPNLINYELLLEKNLGHEVPNEKYFQLLNLYKLYFEQYLKELLPLNLIDENMKKSDLSYTKVNDDDMDFYQSTSNMDLSYIYLRNNFYVEKLSNEDIEFVLGQKEYNDEVKEFIRRTYKNVINPYDEDRLIFYGPENQIHMCNSSDVVLGIRYNEFEQGTLSDSEFEERFFKQKQLINQLSSVLEIAGESQFNMSIRCIQYNEFSIKKNDVKQF